MNFILDETNGHRSQKSTRPTTTNRTRIISSSIERKISASIQTTSSNRKREQQIENYQMAINDLLHHFSHRNLDAIIRVIRMTLEKLRKRITSSTSYGINTFSSRSFVEYLFSGRHRREAPVFKIFAELSIPNVIVRPTIDEVQSYLNRLVQTIITVSKNISQWDKDRSKVSEILINTNNNLCRLAG